MLYLKTKAEIEKIRAAGRVVDRVLKAVGAAVKPGVMTWELEDIAAKIISEAGGQSAFLGYAPNNHPPYPAWTCVSVNEEVVHGIPGWRELLEGDIVTLDTAVDLDGWIADSAWTYPVGNIAPRTANLLKITEEALYRGIAQVKPGRRVSDIARTIQKYVESHGYSVVRELTGHGVGKSLHEDPQVPNYTDRKKEFTDEILQCGMTFAIEPMVNAGRKDVDCLDDRWTITTTDKSLSAHYEHTIAVTSQGAVILTNGD